MGKESKCPDCGETITSQLGHSFTCPKKRRVIAQTGQRSGKLATQAEALRDIIRRGKRTFIEVGEALMAIRDGKLYRQLEHASFQDFCEAEGLSRSYSYRQMAAAKVARNVAIGDKLDSEAQARPLVEVFKAEGPEAVKEVLDKLPTQPTAADVRAVVQRRSGIAVAVTVCDHAVTECICVTCGEVVRG